MNGLYRHYKGGLYAVLGIATDSTNGRNDARMVLYWSLAKQKLLVREISQFNERVKWPDGVERERFMPLLGSE